MNRAYDELARPLGRQRGEELDPEEDRPPVTAGPLACTRAFCASAPLDTQFVGILDGRSSAHVASNRLILRSERGSLVFER